VQRTHSNPVQKQIIDAFAYFMLRYVDFICESQGAYQFQDTCYCCDVFRPDSSPSYM